MTVTKNNKKEQDRTVLPEDFDPMEMAAFLDGEANTEMVRGLTESPALRAVAAAGLDQSGVSDVAAAARLAARAAPLAPRHVTAAPCFSHRRWSCPAAPLECGMRVPCIYLAPTRHNDTPGQHDAFWFCAAASASVVHRSPIQAIARQAWQAIR